MCRRKSVPHVCWVQSHGGDKELKDDTDRRMSWRWMKTAMSRDVTWTESLTWNDLLSLIKPKDSHVTQKCATSLFEPQRFPFWLLYIHLYLFHHRFFLLLLVSALDSTWDLRLETCETLSSTSSLVSVVSSNIVISSDHTHLCPISCAMVKAEPRPMSSLMLQLLSGSHIPATEAKPRHKNAHTHTPDKHTLFRVMVIKKGFHKHDLLFYSIAERQSELHVQGELSWASFLYFCADYSDCCCWKMMSGPGLHVYVSVHVARDRQRKGT